MLSLDEKDVMDSFSMGTQILIRSSGLGKCISPKQTICFRGECVVVSEVKHGRGRTLLNIQRREGVLCSSDGS